MTPSLFAVALGRGDLSSLAASPHSPSVAFIRTLLLHRSGGLQVLGRLIREERSSVLNAGFIVIIQHSLSADGTAILLLSTPAAGRVRVQPAGPVPVDVVQALRSTYCGHEQEVPDAIARCLAGVGLSEGGLIECSERQERAIEQWLQQRQREVGGHHPHDLNHPLLAKKGSSKRLMACPLPPYHPHSHPPRIAFLAEHGKDTTKEENFSPKSISTHVSSSASSIPSFRRLSPHPLNAHLSPFNASSPDFLRSAASMSDVTGDFLSDEFPPISPTPPPRTPLAMRGGAFTIPHPEKIKKGAADAYFIDEREGVAAVADGVGEWVQLGIDPKLFAQQLMDGARVAVRSLSQHSDTDDDFDVVRQASGMSTATTHYQSYPSGSPASGKHRTTVDRRPSLPPPCASDQPLLPPLADAPSKAAARALHAIKGGLEATKENKAWGSSTAIIACLDPLGHSLGVANLGDSKALVLRRLKPSDGDSSSGGSAAAEADRPVSAGSEMSVADPAPMVMCEGVRVGAVPHYKSMPPKREDGGMERWRRAVAGVDSKGQGPCGHQWTVVHRTTEQQHSFNCPYQLANLPGAPDWPQLQKEGKGKLVRLLRNALIKKQPNLSDDPDKSDLYTFDVHEGDLLLMGSDGLFDNLFDDEIMEHLKTAVPPSGPEPYTPPHVVAQSLARRAHQRSFDRKALTPYGVGAQRNGERHRGGKPDDITVVACWVMRAHDD